MTDSGDVRDTTDARGRVAAVVPAAGLSTRMGRPKQLLPFGAGTVIEQVVKTLQKAGLADIVVVTGHCADDVASVLYNTGVRLVFNSEYARGDMLSSVHVGLRALDISMDAALIALGDQPRMQVETVRRVLEAYCTGGPNHIYIPSHQMRRGHPILVPRRFWPDVLALAANESLRQMLYAHDSDIQYVLVETPTIYHDIDTPRDYLQDLLQEIHGEKGA